MYGYESDASQYSSEFDCGSSAEPTTDGMANTQSAGTGDDLLSCLAVSGE
jgi:hypothetical protein